MKQKGFTLVEILGVVIILALISMMFIPRILSRINNQKDKVSEVTQTLIKNTTEQYLRDYVVKYPLIDGNVYCITLQELVDKERLTEPIFDVKTGNNLPLTTTMRVEIKNQKYVYEFDSKTCEITKPPTIYANGQRVYFDVDRGTGCTMEEYASSYDSTVGDFLNSKTGYNGLNGVEKQNSCLLFYAFNDGGGETLNLLLDHNVMDMYWSNGNSIINGPTMLKGDLKSKTSLWNGTIIPKDYNLIQNNINYTIAYETDPDGPYKARLITAQEIAKIIGADIKAGLLFDERTTTYANNIYFDSLSGTASSTCQSGNTTKCNYGWLYDRTSSNCKNYGCYNNVSGGTSYWTATSVLDYSIYAWKVQYDGGLGIDTVSGGYYGIRPVIEVSKFNIEPGAVPKIPVS